MAKPESLPDGSVNLMIWQCTIPGKTGVSSLHISFFDFVFVDQRNFVDYASHETGSLETNCYLLLVVMI